MLYVRGAILGPNSERKQHDRLMTLIKTAIDFDADLIVMATHARRGLSHLLIGSVTEGALRDAV